VPVPPKPITPEMLADARRLYVETTVPVEDICALLGIGTYTFYKRLKKWGWPLRSRRIPVEAPPEDPDIDDSDVAEEAVQDAPPPLAPPSLAPPSHARTARLVALLQDATERELTKLDRLSANEDEGKETVASVEETLRAKAIAGRMLRELVVIQDRTGGDTGDDGFPRDDDELRRELLRKMDALLARRKN
jgi:hypothetical protein